MTDAPWLTPALQDHAQALWNSFYHWTHRPLIPGQTANLTSIDLAQALFDCPHPILSHGGQADPIFNYGNQAALNLWELTWEQLLQMPSRLSAETTVQAARANHLEAVKHRGFVENYRGIRISRTGKRFEIQNTVIWTVLNLQGQPLGQAATFNQWKYLNG